jgi:hypothetical protein
MTENQFLVLKISNFGASREYRYREAEHGSR